MQLNPLLDLPEPDLQILDCIKTRDFDGLKQLHKDGFQWSSLVICPYNFIRIYGLFEKDLDFKGFFKEVGLYKWEDKYIGAVRKVIHDLTYACDVPGDLEYIQAYLKAKYDFHRYRDGTYVRYAIDSYRYDIALLLMQDDAPLTKWPSLLHDQIFWEVDRLGDERNMSNYDFQLNDERIRFMLEHGSPINYIESYISPEGRYTPLDFAIKFNHGPAIEVLKEYGGKRASELEGSAE
ncbi:MAG: hypothetical protein ACO1RX_22865 [Candidatus Sericytochromatia bacterium]